MIILFVVIILQIIDTMANLDNSLAQMQYALFYI